MPQERLQKILARQGIASRRAAEALILQGKVKVNGKPITQLGTKADADHDQISVNGRPLIIQSDQKLYYAYYKPAGLIVSKKDELGRSGIFAQLDLPASVNAVGRLDKDSEGLLLLSNDGDFIYRYTHPSFQVPKIYHVQVSRALTYAERQVVRAGINFEGKKLRAFSIKNIKSEQYVKTNALAQPWIEIELREGVKREIRVMMAHLGIKVFSLIRIQHGEVSLGKLKPGELISIPPQIF